MILPMNAKDAKEKREKLLDDPRYIAEIKVDGYRSICDNGRFHSRLGNDATAKVPHLHEILKNYNVVLDGELYLPNGNSSDVTKILGSLPARALEMQEKLGKLRYIVFDVLGVDDSEFVGMPWKTRRNNLEELFDTYDFGEYIKMSGVYYDKRRLLATAESNGLEGIMLKNINALYYPDKRPENVWYKVKKSMTYDVVVIGYTEGKGKYKGFIGAVEFGLFKGDTLVNCGQCSGFTDEMRTIISEFPSLYLGRTMEISAMERTKDGNFRHPVFKQWRTDKLAKDCRWEQ